MAIVTKLYAMSGTQIIKTKAQIMEEFGMSQRTVDARLMEIRQEMRSGGRYEGMKYAVGGNGRYTLINYLVWIDHEMNRELLKQKNLRKNMPPYNPAKVAQELAIYADKELALEGVR